MRYAPTFHSPWSDFEEKSGQKFEVLSVIDETNFDPDEYDEEVLPKYRIRLEDGTVLDAGPEEVEEGWPGWEHSLRHPLHPDHPVP